MSKFSMDHSKDLKLTGKLFDIKGIGEDGKDLRGKFIGIDKDGRYEFQITTRDTDIEMYMTGVPNKDIE